MPEPGKWPVDPQHDEEEVKEERVWIDGCFDFFHHGELDPHPAVAVGVALLPGFPS